MRQISVKILKVQGNGSNVKQNASTAESCTNPSTGTESIQRPRIILPNGFVNTKICREDLASARKNQGADIQQYEPAAWNNQGTYNTSWDELYDALSFST